MVKIKTKVLQNLKKNSLIENTFENVEESKVLLKDKLLHFFADDFTKKLILLFIFVVIRLLEYSFFRITHNEIGFELFFNRSLNYDFLLVLQFSSVMLIPLLFSFLTNFKLYSIINVSFCFFIILVNISLTHFFLTNETLLDYQNFQISGMVIKRSSFIDFGLIKPSFKLTFGYEFLLRMTHNGVKFMSIPKIGYKHLNLREGSIFWNYKNGDSTLTPDEVGFWIESAKKEFFFINDRAIKYEPQEV